MLVPLLTHIVKHLMTQPDEVNIYEQVADGISSIHISVAQDDIGRVIGSEGRVLKALRNIIVLLASRPTELIIDRDN